MHVSVTSNGKNEEKSAIIILSHGPVTNARITLASKPRSPTSSYKLRVNANPIPSRWISGTVPANELGTSAVSTEGVRPTKKVVLSVSDLGTLLSRILELSAVNFIEDLLYMVFLPVHPLHLPFWLSF